MENKCERSLKKSILLCFLLGLSACSQKPFEESTGHIKPIEKMAVINSAIPQPILSQAILTPPTQQKPEELFTVVVHDLPVNELLFALARDAKKNIDIAPGISGNVTLNAIDQTLPQILERLKRQTDLRYKIIDDTLVVSTDSPYFVQYSVPYINLSRLSENEVSISTQVASTGSGAGEDGGGGEGGGSNSSTLVTSTSIHLFWETLLDNIKAILRDQDSLRNIQQKIGSEQNSQSENALANSVVAHQEAGVVAVRASERKHAEIRKFIDNVVEHASRQVLVEATIVEVELSDEYQTGVDWSVLASQGKYEFGQTFSNLVKGIAPIIAPATLAIKGQDVISSIKMLETFGNTRVLSSPKLMVLNNQTAILKVVRNEVYFTTDAQTDTTQGVATTTFETELHTVPVGLVMYVTPQISSNDTIIINARPTISRKVAEVPDPHPALAAAGVISNIPVIEVREMESVLKIHNGNVGVIGGLMQDTVDNSSEGTPMLSRIPFLDTFFSYKDKLTRKTELVVFIRPRVIKSASIKNELSDFNKFLINEPVTYVPEFK